MRKRNTVAAERNCAIKPGNEPRFIDDALKIELIQRFQKAEGNYDCYATAYSRACNQASCLWRDDCKCKCAA